MGDPGGLFYHPPFVCSPPSHSLRVMTSSCLVLHWGLCSEHQREPSTEGCGADTGDRHPALCSVTLQELNESHPLHPRKARRAHVPSFTGSFPVTGSFTRARFCPRTSHGRWKRAGTLPVFLAVTDSASRAAAGAAQLRPHRTVPVTPGEPGHGPWPKGELLAVSHSSSPGQAPSGSPQVLPLPCPKPSPVAGWLVAGASEETQSFPQVLGSEALSPVCAQEDGSTRRTGPLSLFCQH